jgi:zinc protease
MTGAMLLRGTATKSRQEIEDALDRLRARVSVQGGDTGASATGQTYAAELPDTLRLVAEALSRPSFPADELDRLVRESVTALEATRTDPQAVAVRALRRNGNPYPPGDPRYAPTLDEEIAGIKAVTVDALKAFHAQFYGASHGEIALVGDFDPEAMRTLVTGLFGQWRSPAAYARVPEPLLPNRPAALKFDLADKANAFLIGREALPLNDTSPDYPAFLVVNYLLGGSPTSRLWERLRQKDGLSYGTGSAFQASSFEPNSRLVTYAIFAPQNLGRVRAGIAEEIAAALERGFTDAEVSEATTGLLEPRKTRRASDASLAGALVGQAYLGRTWARSAAIDQALAALTTADVNAALRKYVKPDEFAYAFAGDFKAAGM